MNGRHTLFPENFGHFFVMEFSLSEISLIDQRLMLCVGGGSVVEGHMTVDAGERCSVRLRGRCSGEVERG